MDKKLFVALHIQQNQTYLVSELLKKCTDDYSEVPFDPSDVDEVERMSTRYRQGHSLLTEDDLYTRMDELETEKYSYLDLIEAAEEGQNCSLWENEIDSIEAEQAQLQLAKSDKEVIPILQWWTVSREMADKLLERDEVILDNACGLWWGKTTETLPTLEDDPLILPIIEELMNDG